jgi:hypothetical protein
VLQPWTCHCGQVNAGSAPCSACLNAAPPWVAGAPATAPEPARRRRGALTVGLAIATAVLLVGGLVAAGVVAGREDDGHPPAASKGEGKGDGAALPAGGRTVEVGPDTVPAAGAGDLERALPGLLRFVQGARGLPFTTPVKVTLLPDAAFRERLKASEDEDKEEQKKELRTTQQVLEGLGLLEKGIDLEKQVESFYGDAVAGFYDPEKDDLVVRGEELTVSVRTTLVHELTHALQDQHFDIVRKDLDDRDDEASTGFTGLVEGDAVRIEREYLQSLSLREQKQEEREEAEAAGGIGPDVPPVLIQLVGFPYLVGPEFTTAVVERGGQARLDEAYAKPPTTSEQLLHPQTFLNDQAVKTPANPKADGDQIDEGVLGELGLLLVLQASGQDGRRAAAGWGGDRYVAWRKGDATCVRIALEMDTPQDDAELRKALDDLAGSRKGIDVEGRGPFTLTSCG